MNRYIAQLQQFYPQYANLWRKIQAGGCWIIGLPGWRFYLGRDWERGSGVLMRWAWRERLCWREGEMRYHINLAIRFGRTRESVIDFGGPWWCPWLIRRRISFPTAFDDNQNYSPRWTGRTFGIVAGW